MIQMTSTGEKTKNEHEMKWFFYNSEWFVFLFLFGIILALFLKLIPLFPTLNLQNIDAQNIGALLNGAFFITLVVERSLEVFITIWREPKKLDKENAVDIAGYQDKRDAQAKLQEYENDTKKIALYAGFVLGILASLSGIRLLEQLIDVQSVEATQLQTFRCLDIVLTGLTISGGSSVFHILISVFTDFLAKTRERIDA
jgi:hypothetical protein